MAPPTVACDLGIPPCSLLAHCIGFLAFKYGIVSKYPGRNSYHDGAALGYPGTGTGIPGYPGTLVWMHIS
eukprot:2677025-Rhodomonas_salina.2